MDTDELTSIGEKLFGSRWRKALADQLGVKRETVSRWSHGKQAISATAAKALRLLSENKPHYQYKERRFGATGETVTTKNGATFIHGDARKTLLPHEIDVILTDPVWPNASVPLAGSEDPFTLLSDSLNNLTTYLKSSGRIIIQLGCDSDPRILKAVPSNYPYLRTIWLPYALPSKKGRLLYSGDVAYVFGRPPAVKTNGRLLLGQMPKDFCPPMPPDNIKMAHPCPRNLKHVEWLVEKFTQPDDVILDPFMGSGITGVASIARCRKFIGIEIERKYWKTAVNAIKTL